jgi:hypothetical protein
MREIPSDVTLYQRWCLWFVKGFIKWAMGIHRTGSVWFRNWLMGTFYDAYRDKYHEENDPTVHHNIICEMLKHSEKHRPTYLKEGSEILIVIDKQTAEHIANNDLVEKQRILDSIGGYEKAVLGLPRKAIAEEAA